MQREREREAEGDPRLGFPSFWAEEPRLQEQRAGGFGVFPAHAEPQLAIP